MVTGDRALWAVGSIVAGFFAALIASWWGAPLRNVALSAPSCGFALALLIVRRGAVGDHKRDLLAFGAGVCMAASSGVGLYAVLSVLIYIWAVASGLNASAEPSSTLARIPDAALSVWAAHSGSISFWLAVAITSLLGALIAAGRATRRLVATSREVENGPWHARWISDAVLNLLAANSSGLPLGRDRRGRLLRYRADSRWRGGHHAVIAGTRAGKGVGAVLPAIIDHDGPVVVLDLKGENFAVTRRWRKSLKRQVIVLNAFGVIEDSADNFNPIDYVRLNHLSRDAAVVAEGLVKPESGTGAHFAEMARELLAAAVEVIVRVAEPEHRNMVTLNDMLLGADFKSVLEGWQASPEQVGRPAMQIASTLLTASDNERGAVRSTVKKALEWCGSEQMRDFLAGPAGWSLDDVLEDRADLFVVVPVDQVGPMSVFMRLVTTLMLGAVARQDGHRTLPKPLLLVLDEFVRLGRMQSFETMATVAAGAGVEAMFITQDRGQVEAVYGREATATLFGACATVRIFGLGRTDTATAQWIVEAMGERTVEAYGRHLQGKALPTGSEQATKLFSVHELLELPTDEMIALFPGQRPARIRRIVSHQDREYQNKLDPNPTRPKVV